MIRFVAFAAPIAPAQALRPARAEFPNTDLDVATVPLDKIRADRATRDSTPPVDAPRRRPVGEVDNIRWCR